MVSLEHSTRKCLQLPAFETVLSKT